MEEYDDDKFFVLGGDDDEFFPESPPVWRGVVLFLGIILVGATLTVAIIYCSRVNEKAEKNKRKGTKRQPDHTTSPQPPRKVNQVCLTLFIPHAISTADSEKKEEMLRSNMVCKPWSNEPSLDASTTETTLRSDSSESLSLSSPAKASNDEELQGNSATGKINMDGAVCAICGEEYQEGQPVYESNNPQCGHQAHKRCMDKWLNIQNTCPECIQPFVLRQV